MKQVITHPSHPSHTLNLLVAPVYDGGCFNCDGCGINGTGFSYQCSRCDFDIHALCAYKPLSIIHKSHPQHNLKLAFHSPYGANKGFSCDICLQIGKNQWLYRCTLCEFDAHVGCVTAASPTPQPHLQHSTSAPTPHTHHAGHPQVQNSLQGSNRPRPMPMTRPNRPTTQNAADYGPGRQNNMDYNGQVGPIEPNELIGPVGESFGQGSMDGSGFDGSIGNEEFDGEVNVEIEYEGDVYEEEANEDGEDVDGNGLDIVAYGDDYVAVCSESEFGGSNDARSQCNDLSDADLYPLSLDNTQGSVRMNQNSGGGRRNNVNLNGPGRGPAARSKNVVLNGSRGRRQGSKSPIQSPRGPQTRRVQNVGNNVIGGASGPVSVRVNRLRQPLEFIGPQGFNGPSGGPSNVVDSGGNNDNYNGTNMYVGESAGYGESYDDEYVGGDGDCDFEAGGEDGYGQAYDETYGENDFESYSDITGGSESMYGGDESYVNMDNSQYSGLNDEPNNQQYSPILGPLGGPSINNQIQYGQTGRPRNMGMYERGVTTNMNRYGNNQYRSNGGPYRVNGRPNMMNGGGSIGPNGSNGLGNVMVNAMVQSLTRGFAMNMLNDGGGDVNSGTGDGDQTDLQF